MMLQRLDIIHSWFNSKNALYICFVFAILNRSIMVTHYSQYVSHDERAQLTRAYNLLHGHGLSITKYYTTETDIPEYDNSQPWPPGYSLVMTIFLKIFNNDEFLATTVFDILVGIAFILVIFKICRSLKLSHALTNLFIIIAGCFQYYIFLVSFPTDHISLVLLLWSLLVCVNLFRNDSERTSPAYMIFAAILFALPSFFRYMYIPVSILIPGSFTLFAFINRKKILLKKGVLLTLGTTILLILMIILLKQYNESSVDIPKTESGFFPEQLRSWYPYVPASFINIDFFTVAICKLLDVNYGTVMEFLRYLNILGVVSILALFYDLFFKSKAYHQKMEVKFFLFTGFILSLSIIFLLSYLVLTNKPQFSYNYHLDGRYFAFPVIFTQFLIFILAANKYFVSRNKLNRWIVTVLLIILSIESIHGVISNMKIIAYGDQLQNPYPTNKNLNYSTLTHIFKDIHSKYPDRQLLITSPNNYYMNAVSTLGYKGIYDFENINHSDPTVTKKSLLVLIMHDDEIKTMQKYILEQRPVKLISMSGQNFYLQLIDPGQ